MRALVVVSLAFLLSISAAAQQPSGRISANSDPTYQQLRHIGLRLADGRVVHLGRIRMKGNVTIENEIPLQAINQEPKRAMLNYYGDVLAVE